MIPEEITPEVLNAERQKSGLTCTDFADLLDVSREYLWMLENGKAPITDSVAEKVRGWRVRREKRREMARQAVAAAMDSPEMEILRRQSGIRI